MKNPVIDDLVNNLAQEATIRGMHSTGIAYNKGDKLIVYKKPKNAYELNFKGLNDCVCVTGHTRHATQGSYKKNYNNHPFYGTCKNAKFALSHNGVLWNDTTLRKKYGLPADRIETDSYIAVQLLEHFETLNVENVAKLIETTEKNEIARIRWEIIEFSRSIDNKQLHMRDEYLHIKDNYNRYHDLIEAHNLTNGIITEEIEKINKHYEENKNSMCVYF